MRKKKTVLKFEVTFDVSPSESSATDSDSLAKEFYVLTLNGKPLGYGISKRGGNGMSEDEIGRAYFDYIMEHLEEDLTNFLNQYLIETQVASLSARNWSNPEIERSLKEAKRNLAKAFSNIEAMRLRKRIGANGTLGGSQAKWTPERRLLFLELYENTLGKLQSPDDTLPPDLALRLKMRGVARHELAREIAAQQLKVPNNTYLLQVLKEARRQKAGKLIAERTKSSAGGQPKRKKIKG